jgi:HD-GYP domain-containing protein (c-di-GMP phosphodiesterase class II)
MDNNLKPSSISLLYDGMLVEDDIYDAGTSRILVKGGTILNERLILVVKKHNDDRDTIYVSESVYNELQKREVPVEIANREELEESTGYADAKDRTIELLSEISNSKTIKMTAIGDVAADLSESLGITSPSTITTLINALAPVDEYLQRHCVNLSLLNGLIGRWLGMSKAIVDNLVLIGLLHDCGKALIPPEIINAPRGLTITEFEAIKVHTSNTYDLTKDFPSHIRAAASSHHERMDGSGYPKRLAGEEISLEARITAISDVYDAIVSQRSYKQPRSPFSVFEILLEMRDSALDSDLVSFFIKHMSQELLGKPMNMSDGSVGVVRNYDLEDIRYPTVELNGAMVKTSEQYFCLSLCVNDS